MTNVGYATVSIIPSAKGFKAHLDREIGPALTAAGAGAGAKAGRTSGKHFSTGLAAAAGTAMKAGLAAAGIAAGAALGFGIKTGISQASFLEQAKISFETLLGPGGDAQGYLKSLSDFAKRTPFELPGLVASARSLIGSGTAAKNVIPVLTALGDATGALGLSQDNFASIVRAVTQVQAKGKFQAEEALQIAEAGLPIYPLLAKAMGKPVPEIQKMMSEGKLLAEDALPALYSQMNKDYGGSMEKQSKTLAGTWSTVKDTVSQALGEAFTPLIPILSKILPPAADALAKGIGAVSDGIASLGQYVGPVKDALSGLFSGGGGEGMGAQLAKTGAAVKDFATSLLGPLKEAGAGIIATVKPALQDVGRIITTVFLPGVQKILPVLKPVASFIIGVLGGAIGGAISGVLKVVGGLLKAIGGIFQVFGSLLKGDWAGVWEGLKNIVTGVIGGIIGAIQTWLNVGILNIFRRGAVAILGSFRGLWTGIKGAASSGVNAVKSLFSKGLSLIGNIVKGAIRGYIGFWKALFTGVLNLVKAGWSAIRRGFTSALSSIRSSVSSGLNAVKSRFSSIFEGIRSAVNSKISAVVSIVKGLPGKALSALGSIGTKLYSAGQDLIRGFIRGIQNAASGIIGAISSSITDKIPSFIKDKLGIRSPSRVLMELGGHTGEGFARGIEGKESRITKAADGMARIPASAVMRPSGNAAPAPAQAANFHLYDSDGVLLGTIRGAAREQSAEVARGVYRGTR